MQFSYILARPQQGAIIRIPTVSHLRQCFIYTDPFLLGRNMDLKCFITNKSKCVEFRYHLNELHRYPTYYHNGLRKIMQVVSENIHHIL